LGLDLQDAIDQPAFKVNHFPSSFYPRKAEPGTLIVESSVPAPVLNELRSRGHLVRPVRPWSLGNVTAVQVDAEHGDLQAAATSRGQKAYAMGW
jgi:gamma-glutamyltranspeptidase/glutathione hydrolase